VVTLAVFETEVVSVLGVLKELVRQWQDTSYKCPCVESVDDLWSRGLLF
jgi:hypothetical protein